ncbi:MAG: T9SS type A sorting domain-containing protein [Bacteroidota bacterium]
MKVQIAILSLALLYGSAQIFAQKGKPHKGPKHNPEMRQAMKAYAEENVLPVMQAQREKLDASLSLQEKQTVAEIRAELQALKEKGKNMRQALRQSEAKPTEAQREEMYAHRKEMRLLMNQAWEIADNHEADIRSLLAEIKPQAETWKQQMRAIAEQYRPEDAPERPDRLEGTEGRHGGKAQRAGRTGMMMELRNPVHFLLWDGTAKALQAREEKLEVFPNPTRNVNEVRLRLEAAGKVQIKLLDKDGNYLKTVVDEQLSAGSHTQRIDLQGLEPGLYFYQITTPKGSRTKKIILE